MKKFSKNICKSVDKQKNICIIITVIITDKEFMDNKVTRKSKQRDAVIEFLKETTSHPTAYDVYEKLRIEHPNISLGTVYRNLALLAKDGDILELSASNGQSHFDGNTHPHSHFFCEKCGKIFDVFDDSYPIPDSLSKFNVKTVSVTYYGVCEACENKEIN